MKKHILTGAESFEEIVEGNYFYIDKTMFIKELLQSRGKVTLITRPRRFGKTLNLSMLNSFFDIRKDSKNLFSGLKIMEHQDILEKHLNKYPVISFTLKDVDESMYEKTINRVRILVSEIFQQNLYLYDSGTLNEFQKEEFYRFCAKDRTEEELKNALRFLTACLYTYHKKRVVILLDEYDTPIDSSVQNGYYREMIGFMRGFMGGVFKSNDFLEFGVLTGVQRISKESMISSFNNPKVCGIMSEAFATCFGFTEEEVKEACVVYEVDDQFEKVREWYDGYRFGGQQDMYNPWSITGFLDENEFHSYWANTGSLSILQDIFFEGTRSLKDDIAGLLTGSPIKMKYLQDITYPIIYDNDDVFWSMLLNTGYIKPCKGSTGDVFYAELVNKEVRDIFSTCIRVWFQRKSRQRSIHKAVQKFVDHLLEGDADSVSATLNEELLNDPSYYDLKNENSYHMFIFGILLAVSDDYTVLSNQESGEGRSDCLIKPFDKKKCAAVIEFKHLREAAADLTEEAKKGLEQIEEKEYIHNLKKEGYERILKYCIAFHKKNCEVAIEKT